MSDEKAGTDAYAIVLADLYKQREAIDSAIQAIERLRGVNSGARAPAADIRPSPSGDMPKREDYLGLSIAEAAKRLLAGRRRTMNSAEIAEGLAAANYPMTAADPSNVVGSVLSRRFDSVGDVVRVSRGQWGLPEWYPNRSFRKKEKANGGKTAATPEAAESDVEPPPDSAPNNS